MKALFFDLETTGTYPGKHGIHQMSGMIVIDGVIKEKFDFKVRPNPKAEIMDESLAVAGVTREQILAYPPMEEIYRQFVDMQSMWIATIKRISFSWLATTMPVSIINFSEDGFSKMEINTLAHGFGAIVQM